MIVAIDGHTGVLSALRDELAAEGMEVHLAPDVANAIETIDRTGADALLLNLNSFESAASELTQAIRSESAVPLIVVVASESDDGAEAIRSGADDYTTEPFSAKKIANRVHGVLHRVDRAGRGHRAVRRGDLHIDLDRRLVTRNSEPVHLTKTEWALLHYMLEHAGRVLVNDELLRGVWGDEYEGDVQYLRVWISRLRKKVHPEDGEQTLIKTMQGVGYMLEADGTGGLPTAFQ